jgi:presenilin-like A22 family membrane protease
MADRPSTSTRLVTFLWFLTTAFSVVAVVVRYRRIGEVAWYLVAAAAFTLAMGIATLRRSKSDGV